MAIPLNVILLAATSLYQAIACYLEDLDPPPGELIDIDGCSLHVLIKGTGNFTIVVDHSLGGVEGYLLLEKLTTIGRVCIYDRAGYGWSDMSFHSRTSERIVNELDTLLERANVEPPYLLIGDSFGSYNMRLYAARHPEKVIGLVLTDGLHEGGMLHMSFPLKALRIVFISGFIMSVLGASLGIVRLLKDCGMFELIKPELRSHPPATLRAVKRSFCRPKHWLTMTRELREIQESGRQIASIEALGKLPLVNIKANSFFKPSLWTQLIPLTAANRLREEMHGKLMQLSSDSQRIETAASGHFIWIDEPEAIVNAVKIILANIN